MALITKASHDVFDLAQIQRGDCIHIRRTGDTTFRNGFVTEVTADRLRLLYCNTQNNATSYLDVMAADVKFSGQAISRLSIMNIMPL